MRYLWLVCLCCVLPLQWAVDVVSVSAPDAVVIEIFDVPVVLSLAHLAVPEDEEIRSQCTKLLKELAEGQSVKIKYEVGFGERAGTGRVHVLKSLATINVKLIEAGLARYEPSADETSKYAQQMAAAEEEAKSAKKGLWAKPVIAKSGKKDPESEKPVAGNSVASARPAKTDAPVAVAMGSSAAFCAELTGKYYYAVDSEQAKKLNQQKIVYYKTEAEAKTGGKQKAEVQVAKNLEPTMLNADALMAEGREHYAKAVDMDVSDARDKHYGEAFQLLTQAMLIYRDFFEKDEKNAKLGETLRVCMEMRYGAMKNKRP